MATNMEREGNTVMLVKMLRDCLSLVSSASLNVWKEIFDNKLIYCIQHEDFTDTHLKAVVRILSLTFMQNRGRHSRHAVVGFVRKLLEKYGVSAAKYLLYEIHPIAVGLVRSNSSFFRSSSGAFLLICCAEISKVCTDDGKLFGVLVEVEMLVYSVVCAVDDTRHGKRLLASARLHLVCNKSPEVFLKYIDAIACNEKFKVESLALTGYIFQYLTTHKAVELVDADNKKKLLERFVQSCIQTKVLVPRYLMVHFTPFLKYLTHKDFTDILPEVKRGLLRNPETILQAVGFLLNGLSIDLSSYMDELSRCVTAHLASQNISLRDDAVVAVGRLTQQCTDPTAIETMMKRLVQILEGFEGKVSTPEQRCSVYSAIEKVSYSATSSRIIEDVALVVFQQLMPVVIQEGNEGALIQALIALKGWCRHFVTEIPKDLTEFIKKGISSKMNNSFVRAHYFQLAGEALKGNTLLKGKDLLDALKQAVDKSVVHQINSVYEALSASTLIAWISFSDDNLEKRLEPFWTSVLHPEKRPLIPDKFLAVAPVEYLAQLLKFMNVLFLHHHEKVAGKNMQPWYQAFHVLLLRGDWNIVKQTKTLITKITESEVDVVAFNEHIFSQIHGDVIAVDEMVTNAVRAKTNGNTDVKLHAHLTELFLNESDDVRKTITRAVSAYLFLATCARDHGEDLLLKVLLKIHHPLIIREYEDILSRMALRMNVDLKKVLVEKAEEIVKSLTCVDTLSQMHMNALSTLLKLSPSTTVPLCMNMITANFRIPALKEVTEYEFGVLHTCNGEAYDRSIYESAKVTEAKNANIKREAKAYSFKEQKAEMELREVCVEYF